MRLPNIKKNEKFETKCSLRTTQVIVYRVKYTLYILSYYLDYTFLSLLTLQKVEKSSNN